MWITRTSIANPVFATMVMVGITVLGLFSYQRLRVEQMPDVSLPFVMIATAYPGAAPEAVEADVTKPIENAVNQVSGVKRIFSNSREGSSQVFVEFRMSTDVQQAIQDVRDKIALVRPGFPKDVKDPLVNRVENENNQPVASLAVLSQTTELRELTSLTDQTIVKALENLPGVARIDVNGRLTRQILVQIKPHALTALGIGVDQVIAAIRNANQDVPAGRLTRGASDAVVRIEGKLKDPGAVRPHHRRAAGRRAGLPVAGRGRDRRREGGALELRAHQRAPGDHDRRAQGAGREHRRDRPQRAAGGRRPQGPAALRRRGPRRPTRPPTRSRRAVNRVKYTILEGALLTVLIVFLFLHSWRSTVITGLTLPISVVATFIALYAFGFTLNFLTLMALSLCIGLLIDDAIVVRENIVRHLAMGKDHLTAARQGTEEIGLAVMATTFAIVAVFVPIAFMSGIIGRFFFQFGLTVAVAVLVSCS